MEGGALNHRWELAGLGGVQDLGQARCVGDADEFGDSARFRDRRGALGGRIAEVRRRYGVAELSVFGSVARGDDTDESDVDLLYVARRG
ncbi:nucleotidyltransferase family protein [Frankia tisae]|uniref:nucleotidyltransferase family protein n=1 Tax=Frankia tisae TaxID=2950104 RepID=UPI0021C04791|nr:nucleotidyltransferase domain-containing protein [Frankia tisae]